MAVWSDPVLERFYDRWHRNGDLMVTAGVTGLFTWVAAAVPTAAQTHVNIWPPLLLAIAVGGAGIYTIIAANSGRWLPGRCRVLKDEQRRMMAAGSAMGRDDENARAMVKALNALGESLKQIAERLPPGDQNP